MPLVNEIVAMQEELTRWRRDIHAHPELGFEEARTAAFVANKLQEFGLQVHQKIGKTGVVGVLKVGNETRSLGLRADMDALPIHERNSFEHRSQTEGVMHACGHDGHTTMLLAAAKYLSETQNFRGQVNFIFQPAEEGIGGARAMIEDGLFNQFPCDMLLAMHNAPRMEVGTFAAIPGIRTAAGAFFDITVTGKGAHGAFPDQGVDPVLVASELVVAAQSIISRNMRPTQTAALSITQIHAGDAYNVIPGAAKLSGTVRTLDHKSMQKIERRLNELVSGICMAHGASGEVDFRVNFHPVNNDQHVTEIAANVCSDLVGSDKVVREGPASTGSEDFSFMSEVVPSCYINVGNGADSHSLHNHDYDFNDEATVYGASFFARVVESQLPVER